MDRINGTCRHTGETDTQHVSHISDLNVVFLSIIQSNIIEAER